MPKNAILDPNKVGLPGVMEKLIEHVTEGSLRREMRSSGTTMPHDNAYGLRRSQNSSDNALGQHEETFSRSQLLFKEWFMIFDDRSKHATQLTI